MKYEVRASRTLYGDAGFQVFCKDMESLDDWVYEPYILGIEPDEDGDIVLPFVEYLNTKYKSVVFERDSLIDMEKKFFTAKGVMKVKFLDINDAKDYAMTLSS